MMQAEPLHLITPAWPCPPNVRSLISTRRGGCSQGPYAGANLGDHVGDDPAVVAANRVQLARQTGLPDWPWLQQVHGTDLINLAHGNSLGGCADGAYTTRVNLPCAVLTADCLPILICNTRGTQVAAVHAGWRGLAAGIVDQAVGVFTSPPRELLAYLGPAIGPRYFEVGGDVRQAYVSLFNRMERGKRARAADWRLLFNPSPTQPGHFLCDLCGLARYVLFLLGVVRVYGGDLCTYADSDRFYSYRRDGVTGRLVSAVWLT